MKHERNPLSCSNATREIRSITLATVLTFSTCGANVDLFYVFLLLLAIGPRAMQERIAQHYQQPDYKLDLFLDLMDSLCHFKQNGFSSTADYCIISNDTQTAAAFSTGTCLCLKIAVEISICPKEHVNDNRKNHPGSAARFPVRW